MTLNEWTKTEEYQDASRLAMIAGDAVVGEWNTKHELAARAAKAYAGLEKP